MPARFHRGSNNRWRKPVQIPVPVLERVGFPSPLRRVFKLDKQLERFTVDRRVSSAVAWRSIGGHDALFGRASVIPATSSSCKRTARTLSLDNAPATVRRLFQGCNEGKQLLRVAE